jgi:lipid-A-disaccharide synthase-like uncharacterized protein
MRRPSLKSTVSMSLLAAGMLTTGVLIFRGAGAPIEPARVTIPADRTVRLDEPGTYVVFAEQVAAPQPLPVTELHPPEIVLSLTGPAGGALTMEEAGLGAWLFKFLSRQRGHTLYTFTAAAPGEYRVSAELAEVAGVRPDRTVMLAFAPTASAGRFVWLLLGFSGQVLFTLRFLVQWLASEKAGRSTVPRSFWYYSLLGGLMVLLYAFYTRDPVFIMAFAFNSFIYVRNLVLIRREDRAAAGAGPAAEPGRKT